MKRIGKRKLTALETLLMQTLWLTSPASVREVKEHLEPTRPMAYNTVLTMMRILRDKGFVSSERVGRSDIYTPTVSREQMADRSLRDTLESFFTSPAAMVSNLLESEDLSVEQLADIRKQVDARLRQEKGSKS